MAFGASTLTVQDVITRVKRQFGDEAGVQVTDDDIIRWVNDGTREIVSKNGILRTKATTNVVAGMSKYAFPADILTLVSITFDGRPVRHMSFQDAQQWVLDVDPDLTATGTPEIWYEWANELNFYPTPNASITGGIVSYYVRAPALATDGLSVLELPNRYFDRLMEYVMHKAYQMDDDTGASQAELAKMESNLNALAEEETNPQNLFYPTITVLYEDM